MARTTTTAVQTLLGADYDTASSPDLTPFVDTATAVVDDIEECDGDRDNVLSDARLELIERWLAAHFYALRDQPYQSKSTSAGGSAASATFQGRTGMYYEASKYGQAAVRLDKSGCLAAEAGAERRVAGITWLGKTEAQEIDWEDRN